MSNRLQQQLPSADSGKLRSQYLSDIWWKTQHILVPYLAITFGLPIIREFWPLIHKTLIGHVKQACFFSLTNLLIPTFKKKVLSLKPKDRGNISFGSLGLSAGLNHLCAIVVGCYFRNECFTVHMRNFRYPQLKPALRFLARSDNLCLVHSVVESLVLLTLWFSLKNNFLVSIRWMVPIWNCQLFRSFVTLVTISADILMNKLQSFTQQCLLSSSWGLSTVSDTVSTVMNKSKWSPFLVELAVQWGDKKVTWSNTCKNATKISGYCKN